MHYAAQLATAFTSPTKRKSSFSSYPPNRITWTNSKPVRRITINVGGERFQTYEETLARYPTSLLGSPVRRQEYYDLTREELVFRNRDKEVFNAILFFYQAKILSRPEHVPLETFAEEIKFFELTSYSDECAATEEKTLAFPGNTENSLRCRLWTFLQNPTSKSARAFVILNQFLLFVWILQLCFETQIESDVDCGKKSDGGCWFIMDTLFVLWFTIDYLLYILTAPHLVRYACSPEGLVDLVTVLPYYLKLLTKQLGAAGIFSPWFEALGFMRIFRVFKASRRSVSFRILVETLASSARDFPVWSLLLIMHIFCFSSILYFIEIGNPQFSTIPDAMWFTVITMCTIGYGDVVPQSTLGKFVTAIAAISGIIIVYCIPAPTLKHNFIRVNKLYTSKKKRKRGSIL